MELSLFQSEQIISKQKPHLWLIYGFDEHLVNDARLFIANCYHQKHELSTRIPDVASLTDSLSTNLDLFAKPNLLDICFAKKEITKDLLPTIESALSSGDTYVLSFYKSHNQIKNKAWFKKLAQEAAVVSLPSVNSRNFQSWLKNRCHAQGLNIKPDAFGHFANTLNGDIPTALQQIYKFSYLFESDTIPLSTMKLITTAGQSDQAFELVTAILSQDKQKTLLLCRQLSASIEPTLLLWQLRQLTRILFYLVAHNDDSLLKQSPLLRYRSAELHRLAKTLPLNALEEALALIKDCDMAIKSQSKGSAPQLFEQICGFLLNIQLVNENIQVLDH